MANYIRLPNGAYYEAAEGQSYGDAVRAAYKQFPQAFGGQPAAPTAKTGLMADIGSSIENLANITRTGLGALLGDTTAAAQAGAQREQAIGEKYEPTFQTEKITKPFEEGQYGTAAAEAVKAVPGAVAQLAPSVAQEAGLALAGRIAGGALGALGGPGGAAIGQQVGQYALPLVVNAIQALGSQAQAKIQEQVKAGEKPDVDALELAPYAAANAAANLVGARIAMPSIFKKAIGQKVEAEAADAARAALMKEAEEIAGRGTLKTIGMGVGKFAVGELPTEIFQDVVDRAAIGKPLADEDAFTQYRSTAIGMVLGSPLGGGFGVYERAGARTAVAKQQEEDARKAAAEAEAAKNAPEALAKLDTDFRTAQQQLQALNAQVESIKPKKGATEDEKAAYDRAKAERATFINDTYKPLKMEFDKRKGAIEKMQLEQQTALETEAAAGQQAAKLPLASDLGRETYRQEDQFFAQPFQLSDTARLMHEHDVMRNQVADLEQKLAAGPDLATQEQLMGQRQQLLGRMQEMAPIIDQRGGTTATEAEFTKQLAAAEKERLRLLETGDFDAAAKQAAKVQQMQARLPHLQELKAFREQAGQTRELFKPEDLAQPESTADQQVSYVSPTGKPIEPFATKPEEAAAVEAEKPSLKAPIIDIFDPGNILRTAINSGDTKTINDMTAHAQRVSTRKTLDEKAAERKQLVDVLESRLDLGGEERATTEKGPGTGEQLRSVKRERADLFSKQYDAKQQALFKNGTYPDKELQALYDKGGAAAVEYENVMRQVEELSKQVTTKQRNAKQSLIEQLIDLAKQHEELKAQLESGVATPTMGEKAAALQAKLGKGEAPAARQMDAAERYQAQRRLDAIERKYRLVEGQVAPVRDQILKLYDSLYVTTPLEKPSKIAATKKAEAEAEARKPKAMSRTARTAARLAKGDVRKEAEASAKMRDLARDLGMEEAAYKTFEKNMLKRREALIKKHGKYDPAVTAFQAQMAKDLTDKAIELGKKTPEYKATLKEQVAYFQEVLPTAGKQEVPTKRTGQVTRKQSAAPSRLVTSSAESRAQTEAEALRLKRRTLKDMQEALDSENIGTAYRLREGDVATTVDATEAQKVIDGLKLPENVKFVYAATPKQIPVRLLKMMANEGVDPTEGMVQGAVFSDGTVLVVGDQHSDVRDLEETIAHELMGHYGIDTIIGTDRLNAYAKKTDVIKLAEEIGGKPLVSEVMNTVRANADLGRSEEVQKLQALREIIAHTAEARVTESFRQKAGRWMKELVGMVRAGLRAMGFKNLGELSTSDVYYMLKKSYKAFANKTIGPYRAADGQVAFRLKRDPSEYGIGRPAGVIDTFLGNVMGLSGRVQFVDQYAALEAALKKGLSAGQISSLEATNANYLLRFGQQVSQFAGQFLTNGRVKLETTKKDGGVESVYRSIKGPNLSDVAQAFSKATVGRNPTEREDMFTLYLAGQRAGQVGWEKLNFKDPAGKKELYNSVLAQLDGNPESKKAFEEAAKLYQEYNAGLLDFLVETGALSAKKAAELKRITYVPYYRVKDGEVQLMIDKEHHVTINNIKEEPQLQQLVGDSTEIMPVFTSAVQNTFMLTSMALRNQAVKETAFTLRKLGIASRVAPGAGPSGSDVVRFKKNGEDHYAVIDTDMYGIPAQLIVRGMEGIKTSMPAVIRMLGMPANLLRAFVVRNPTYAIRQVVRDPLNAWLTTGTDAVPVLSSMKELASMVAGRSEAERKLMEAGAISSNIYAGNEQDMAKFLKDVSAGRSGWDRAMAKLDAFALQGDAATRAVVYKDSLAKGMTEQEALLRTLESMNFSRRGVSPSMQALSIMIPFFNAQIQGLDVLYRAFKGDMPYSEQLKIREKMISRGLMMAMGTIAYAAMMEDDEAYKRAKPEERYGNWFVYIPGVKEPLRVPIPFELGYLFKALPEAVYNIAANDEKAGKALGGVGKLVAQTNPFSLPQAVKPLTEVVLGKSFFSGDIESEREKQTLATQRYRENSTEVAKMIGAITGQVSDKANAINIDYLIRGYTGGLGIALVSLANPILASDQKASVAKPSMKPSQVPFIGGLFQPAEGRGTLDEAYDRMQEVQRVKGAYNKLLEEGRQADARAFAQDYASDLAAVSVSGSVQKRLGEVAKQERIIKASPRMTTEQKDAELERLDQLKLKMARQFLALSDKTTPR